MANLKEIGIVNVEELKNTFYQNLKDLGPKNRVLIVPPDYTRFHSFAGKLTEWAWEFYGDRVKAILPALGTHTGMTSAQIKKMFGKVPEDLFVVHNWREDVVTLGEVPAEYIRELSEGKVNYSWPVQVNKLLLEGDFDLILSIGQVVPHEVVGMANHNKNIFVGTGGPEGINKSHFLGAVYGMERMMGRTDTPVRRVFNYGSEHFAKELPIYYVLTVIGSGDVKGLFCGYNLKCFEDAAALAFQENFNLLDAPLKKVVVYLDPEEFKSTWLGNKSIYRTRMAMADGGELIVIAPGLIEFGEDKEIDRLIRKYGYHGTESTLDALKDNSDLADNLSAAAHLIHGSSEGRFNIRYCPGKNAGNLSQEEIEAAGFLWGDIDEYCQKLDFNHLVSGLNKLPDGSEVYYINNPALGLWASKDRFTA